ncbi:MAG: hypothetical protein JO020_32190 [Chloroflexi bacterium]|nr:hypothetical protein [Chloroflexota bacterium]MBV9898840.1 hypothetical protein [Chloroflexota bacterium]
MTLTHDALAWTGIPAGRRTIRGAARVQVDLPGVLSSSALASACSVRVLDLSSSGARLETRPTRGSERLLSRDSRVSRRSLLDRSSAGAELLGGPDLEVGAACQLSFLPPGRTESVWLTCRAVRRVEVEQGQPMQIAVTFSGPPLSFRLDLVHP